VGCRWCGETPEPGISWLLRASPRWKRPVNGRQVVTSHLPECEPAHDGQRSGTRQVLKQNGWDQVAFLAGGMMTYHGYHRTPLTVGKGGMPVVAHAEDELAQRPVPAPATWPALPAGRPGRAGPAAGRTPHDYPAAPQPAPPYPGQHAAPGSSAPARCRAGTPAFPGPRPQLSGRSSPVPFSALRGTPAARGSAPSAL
jgi:hypothetical protein